MLNSALNSSLSALRASSAGLNTVSQNIANAGNENYTAIESVFSSNQLGGVSIEPSFNRNEGLNRRRAYQESSVNYEATLASGYDNIQNIFNSQGQFSAQLSWQNLSNSMMNVNNLSGEALQTILYDSSSALVSSIKSTGEQLDGAISSIMVRQGVEVGVVNDLLFNIDALNKQLPSQDKFQQNAILDQRQGLVEQLNRYTGTQIVLDESTKRITIFSDKGDTLLSDKATVFNAFMTASGSIGADNQLTADTIGYKKELADVYNDAATRVNNIMTAGTLNDGSPGVPIFSLTVDPSKASLAISDKSKIASKYPQTVDANPVITSMSIIEAKAGLQTKSHQDSYQLTNQYLESLKQEKQNTAGVSLENEALKMMQLQNMYEANLKMFSVVDSMMKDTINIIQ